MSSNEEYLDSLLKSVTAKEQSNSNGSSNIESGNVPEKNMSEGISSVDLEQMLASEANAESNEEKAFSDPGALFFADEEDEESLEDSFLAIEDIPEDDEENVGADNAAENIVTVGSVEEDIMAMTDGIEDMSVVADSAEEDVVAVADGMAEDLMAAADNMEEEVITGAEEGLEEDIIAMADNMENVITDTEGMEEDIFAMADHTEEEGIAAAEGMEEDINAMADNVEDIITDAEGMEEDIFAMADHTEEEGIAAAEGMEEDINAIADNVEDIITNAEGMEEDIFAMADHTEEDAIAAAESAEEDIFAIADSMEEDVIAAADGMEDDIIAMADSVEEVHDNAAFEDESFKEISDLLASSGDGDDDMFAMLEGVEGEAENVGIDIGLFDVEESTEETVEEIKEGRKKKKKEKKKREKRNRKKNIEPEEGVETEEAAEELVTIGEVEKKPGIFKRFVDFLMEEDDDEEETGKVRVPISEDDDLFVGEEMGENEAILQELDKEDAKKKSKKADKKKKKKDKKGKNEAEDSEADEDELEEKDGKEKKKAKKEKKKKKEKEVEEKVPEVPGKKISVKKIEVTAVFCLTILAAILLAVKLIPSTLEKNRARDAYYAKDYAKVVEGFYGEELSESDSIMYNRAYTILRLQRKIDGYNNYMRMGKETEALNQLIEGVIRYREIYADAEKYNVTAEIDEIYQMIEDALQNRYGISTTVAEGLYTMEEDNLAYTLKLESIINGTEYVAPVYDEAEETEPETTEE